MFESRGATNSSNSKIRKQVIGIKKLNIAYMPKSEAREIFMILFTLHTKFLIRPELGSIDPTLLSPFPPLMHYRAVLIRSG